MGTTVNSKKYTCQETLPISYMKQMYDPDQDSKEFRRQFQYKEAVEALKDR
jgi:hypothetical protein